MQTLLESGRVADSHLLPFTSKNVILVKTVLSYYHACKMTKPGDKATATIPDCLFHFLIPLCAVVTRGEFVPVWSELGDDLRLDEGLVGVFILSWLILRVPPVVGWHCIMSGTNSRYPIKG